MRIKNKKGMTLVELIIACAVMGLVVLAASGALFVSLDNYKNSNIVSNNSQNSSLLSEYLKGNLSKAKSVSLTKALPSFLPAQNVVYFRFNGDSDVVITQKEPNTAAKEIARIKGISHLEVKSSETGEGNNRRLVCEYTIKTPIDINQYSIINGSVILKNSFKTALNTSYNGELRREIAVPGKTSTYENYYFCVYLN